MINKTLAYYNNNAEAFAEQTQNVDFGSVQFKFMRLLPSGGMVLDFGCGSGRDTKAFLGAGFRVDAWDGSYELCQLASENTGIKVEQHLFQDLSCEEKYDGIWACSSILHLNMDELQLVLQKITKALKSDGVFYTSFKYGVFSGYRNGRFFTDLTENSFDLLRKTCPGLELIEQWRTGDVRPGRETEQWLNLLLRKSK